MTNPPPPPTVQEPPMSHKKAIELLKDLLNYYEHDFSQDDKSAITMAMATLIAEKLNLER